MTAQTAARSRFLRRLLIDLSIMLVIGLVLALLGPFGSFNQPFVLRLVNWVGLALAGYAFYAPISGLVVPWGKSIDLPEWALWIASVLIATIPMSLFVWWLGFLGRDFRWPQLDEAFGTYVNVLIIGAGITVLFHILQREPATHRSEEGAEPVAERTPVPEPASGPRFLERLPPELGTELIALEMEDHYVRAHTALGSELVLLRMRDAVAELEGIEGEQVHRSWWVARGAVADVQREGRNVRLVLDNGIVAPVSRANISPLKSKGWF